MVFLSSTVVTTSISMDMNPPHTTPSISAAAGLITALLLFLSTSVCFASSESAEYLIGKETADSGDYEKAFQIFQRAAQQGDAWSQFGAGVLYLKGQGTTQDTATSTRWFQKAAKQGHAFAQFNLGNAYLHGRGVEPDQEQAAYWWLQAAEQGNQMAQNNLGTLLYFNVAMEQSKRLGMAWLEAAASRNDQTAKKRLAEIASIGTSDEDPFWQSEPEQSEVKILTSNPGHYSINLFTAKLKSSIRRFLGQYNLTGKTQVYRIPRDGGFWYGILFGNYKESEAANKTLANMRPELVKQGPWVVSFTTIQDGIRTIHAKQLAQPR